MNTAVEEVTTEDRLRAGDASQAPLEDMPAKTAQVVPYEPPTGDMTPMLMLDRAITSGASVEVLERLMGLQERHEANQARKAFDAAMTSARSELPTIIKSQTGHNYKYEDLPAIAKAIDPILSEHGLSYRWNTESNGSVKVTCVISHRDGHSESNSLTAAPDTTGSKNPIQALGSAVTYLQRYTLKAALGLSASKDTDAADVGRGSNANGKVVTAAQCKTLTDLADEVGADKEKFCSYMQVHSLAGIPESRFQQAVEALEAKRGK